MYKPVVDTSDTSKPLFLLLPLPPSPSSSFSLSSSFVVIFKVPNNRFRDSRINTENSIEIEKKEKARESEREGERDPGSRSSRYHGVHLERSKEIIRFV